MALSTTDLEAYVRRRAPEIARDIRKVAQKSRNEADLVAEVDKLLEKFAKNFDVTLTPERERTLISGRADAVYNRFIIEYEPPNSLQRSNAARANKHAVEQVRHYLEGLERLDKHRKERLAGVVLDGGFYIFVRYRDGHWRIDDPLPVDAHSTETFLRYLLSLSTELALTPDNLVRGFGENSDAARQAVPALYAAIKATDNPKANILFSQWQRQFREVSGYDESGGQIDVGAVAKSYAVRDREPDVERLFFVIHTYYAAFIKLLALQVAHYYLMPKVGTGLAAVADYDDDRLRKYLQDMERGGLFAQLGIRNFLEGDFFGWYLDLWDESLASALRRLIGDLANYSLVTLDVDPEETRDLLKKLYQNLMPKKLRHALGEYYTPDWLAERLLNQLGYDGDPARRLLDPAVGSGTFVVLSIKRARRYADDKALPPARVLEQILNNIVGFDLNPLAVISARTNYLLALGDLLQHRKSEISIPIYLADSILTPTMDTSEGGQLSFLDAKSDAAVRKPGYSFNTAVGRFSVPRLLVTARDIDALADLLEESVGNGLKAEQFRKRLLKAFPLDAEKDEADIVVATALYEQLLELDRKGINGIWARIIKNAFAPLFQGRFDYVAGNPPWVNWESLPEEYRQETAPLWAIHNLFPHKGFEAILGKAKDDISVLLTYVALDKYLKNEGRLGFLITQSIFKTAGAGQGFRGLRLGDGTPLCIVYVDDMAALKPFEGASNRTAIVIIEKNRATKYPVPYTRWIKEGGSGVVSEELSVEEVQAMTVRLNYVAEPVDMDVPASPWISGRRRALKAVRRLLGESDYQARSGVCTWLNGAYWLEIIDRGPDNVLIVSNLSHEGRQKIENVQAAIEPDLVYPLARGRDVRRWKSAPSAHILVTHKPDMGLRAIPEGEMSVNQPKTYSYLKNFESKMRQRSGYRRYFRDIDPFYSLFNVGDYSFAPFRVCWAREDMELRAAVIGSAASEEIGTKQVIVDQTLQFVPCAGLVEAHYVCALLNNSISNYIARSYTSDITTRIMNAIPVKKFDNSNPVHHRLAQLSQQAHAATAANDVGKVAQIEAEIDHLAAQMWGLTDAELKEIQESLAELG